MIRLLIKIHNVTGLKYLCKTEKDDWRTYQGSGKYWSWHIGKHGFDVTTILLYETASLEDFKRVAMMYSEIWDIVRSDEWANLIPECGEGTPRGWSQPHSVEHMRKLGQSLKGKPKTLQHRLKYMGNRNSAGKIWMNDGAKNTRILESDVESYFKLGYVRGQLRHKGFNEDKRTV